MDYESEYEEARRQYAYHRDRADRHRKQAVENDRIASGHDAVAQEIVNLYPTLTAPSEDVRTVVSPFERSGVAQVDPPVDLGALPPRATPPAVIEAHLPVPGPRGAPALEALLRPNPGVYYTSAQIGEMLVERGWADPGPEGRAAVRANINRAVKAGVMKKRPLDGRAFEYAWGFEEADDDRLLDLAQEVAVISSRPCEAHGDTDTDESFPDLAASAPETSALG